MNTYMHKQFGFNLVEMAIVLVIIGILSAIIYPGYLKYVTDTKRADMMVEMQNIASSIESQKLAKGKYSEVDISSYKGDFPRQGSGLYTITITPNVSDKLQNKDWIITATPKPSKMMKDDGVLTFDADGVKCRIKSTSDKKCGKGNQWKD